MAEWSIAPDLKSGKGNTFQGSNPCLSVLPQTEYGQVPHILVG